MSKTTPSTQCEDRVPDALCQTLNATLFVSYDFNASDIHVPFLAQTEHDIVAKAYIDQTHEVCAEHGGGRILMEKGAHMTVTACDVIDGHLVAIWEADSGQIRLTGQTFGPMAYGAMLIQAAVCLYLATLKVSPQATSAVVIGLVAGCVSAAVLHGIQFISVDDARFFWCVGAWALCLAISGWCADDAEQRCEACLHALSMLACAVYRTPENAYAGLLALVLAVRMWDKVLRWERWLYNGGAGAPEGWRAVVCAVDCLLSAPILLGGARVGLAPSFVSEARWPFFAGTGLYICFVFATHRNRE